MALIWDKVTLFEIMFIFIRNIQRSNIQVILHSSLIFLVVYHVCRVQSFHIQMKRRNIDVN